MTAIKVGVTNGNAFFGTGGPYFNNDGTVRADADGATGLLVSNLTVGLALIKPTAAATQPAQYKSFFALKASGNISLVGIDGLTASITNASIEINDATRLGTGAALPAADFSTSNLSIPTGIGTDPVVITAKGRLIRAKGTVTLGFGGFIYVSGTIGFSKGQQITGMTLVGGGPAGTLDVITVEATGVNVFAGVDGPASQPGAKGISIQNVNMGLAILKPTPAAAARATSRSASRRAARR